MVEEHVESPETSRELTDPVSPVSGKRLLRSRKERVLGGVCGGLSAYMGIDAVLVRVLWVLLTLVTAIMPGVILYIVALIIVPENKEEEVPAGRSSLDGRVVWGGLFILAGLYLLSRALWGQLMPAGWLEAWNQAWHFLRALTLPAVLIGVGLLFLLGIARRNGEGTQRLCRPRKERMLAGVCSGLGRYFRLDPVWVRLAWVLFFLLSWWAALLMYFVAMLLMPEE